MMSRRRTFICTALVVSGLLFGSCGPPETFDRQQMLADTTDEVILPTHEKLGETADELTSATETFCEGERTSDDLETARGTWRELQGPLKQIQAWSFNMSPYRGASFGIAMYKIDREPSWGDNIEAVIAGDGTYRQDLRSDGDDEPDKPFADGDDTTIDETFIVEQDYLRNAKGYPAVEYLLFGEKDGTDMETLYQSDDDADRRCDYLVAATRHAGSVVDEYVEAWDRDGGDFASRFDSATPEDMDWTTVQDSVDALVSQMVFVSKQRVSKTLLGGPLGQHTDDHTVPDSVSSPHANASLAQIEASLDGLEMIYAGPEGQSLADYTSFRKASVQELVRDRLDAAKSAVDEIPEPLETAVDEETETVEAAQSAVDELTTAIEADLKTTLGASTTRVVVDND